MNLNQITIPSLDLNKSVPFYQKLGLLLIVDAIPDYARFECPEGDATFSVHKVTKLPKGSGISVYFECSDLDGCVNDLSKKESYLKNCQTTKDGYGGKQGYEIWTVTRSSCFLEE